MFLRIWYKLFLGFIVVASLAAIIANLSLAYLIILFFTALILSSLIAYFIAKSFKSSIELKSKVGELLSEVEVSKQDYKEQVILLENTKELMAELMDELERTNQELQELDKMRNDFIAYIIHELRAPILPICEGISLIKEELFGPINDKQKDMLEISYKSGRRLSNMVNKLLDIAKMEAGQIILCKEKTNINGIVKEVCETFFARAQSKNIDLKMELLPEDVLIFVDKDKVTEIFNNLISNAFKFTEKGSITIKVEFQEEWILCSVADTGRGVAESDLLKLFEKFQQVGVQTKDKGTGLGLSLVKGNVELHGGQISVESKESEGTKFLFTLPKYSEDFKGE